MIFFSGARAPPHGQPRHAFAPTAQKHAMLRENQHRLRQSETMRRTAAGEHSLGRQLARSRETLPRGNDLDVRRHRARRRHERRRACGDAGRVLEDVHDHLPTRVQRCCRAGRAQQQRAQIDAPSARHALLHRGAELGQHPRRLLSAADDDRPAVTQRQLSRLPTDAEEVCRQVEVRHVLLDPAVECGVVEVHVRKRCPPPVAPTARRDARRGEFVRGGAPACGRAQRCGRGWRSPAVTARSPAARRRGG